MRHILYTGVWFYKLALSKGSAKLWSVHPCSLLGQCVSKEYLEGNHPVGGHFAASSRVLHLPEPRVLEAELFLEQKIARKKSLNGFWSLRA